MQILFIFGINNTFTWLKNSEDTKRHSLQGTAVTRCPCLGRFFPPRLPVWPQNLEKREQRQARRGPGREERLRVCSLALLLP